MNLYTVDLVAELIGAPEKEVHLAMQAMDVGTHLARLDRGDRLTEGGVLALLDVFDVDAKKTPPGFWEALKADAADYVRQGISEVVFVQKAKNRRMVVGEASGQRVRVHVHDNGNFRPGMVLPVEWVEGDLYRITRPSPRRWGKW